MEAGQQSNSQLHESFKGKYTSSNRLTVKGLDEQRTHIIIEVLPFLDAAWAHFIYVLSLTLIYFVFEYCTPFMRWQQGILEQKNRNQNDISPIFHEIRTPLTMIVSIENMLQRNVPRTDKNN